MCVLCVCGVSEEGKSAHLTQPGSTVQTSFIAVEAERKHMVCVCVLCVCVVCVLHCVWIGRRKRVFALADKLCVCLCLSVSLSLSLSLSLSVCTLIHTCGCVVMCV